MLENGKPGRSLQWILVMFVCGNTERKQPHWYIITHLPTYLCCIGCFPAEPELASSHSSFFLQLFWKRIFTRAALVRVGISCRHVSVSVCPSICLSQVGILLKWLNVDRLNNAT